MATVDRGPGPMAQDPMGQSMAVGKKGDQAQVRGAEVVKAEVMKPSNAANTSTSVTYKPMDSMTQSVLEHLGSDAKSDGFFTGDALDMLSNRGSEGMYIVNGPKNEEGISKQFAFYKSGNVALKRELKGNEKPEELIDSFQREAKLQGSPPKRSISEGTQKRLDAARQKAQEEISGKAAPKGGSATLNSSNVASQTTKKSTGFFTAFFSKIGISKKASKQEFQGVDETTKKNMKNALQQTQKAEGGTKTQKAKAKEVDFDTIKQNVSDMKDKLVDISVRHKNLKADDPGRKELNQDCKRGIEEANNALKELKELKKSAKKDPEKMKELEKNERDLKAMITVLKSISGEKRKPSLNKNQRKALEHMKNNNHIEYSKLIQKMSRKELQGLVNEQVLVHFESPNPPDLTDRAVINKFKQGLGTGHKFSDMKMEDWFSEAPLSDQTLNESLAYQSSERNISEQYQRISESYENAKKDVVRWAEVMKEVFNLEGDEAAQIDDLLKNGDKLLSQAKTLEEKEQVAIQLGKDFKRIQAGLLLKMEAKLKEADDETQESWMKQIKEAFPQYDKPIYKQLGLMVAQMKSPAMADTVSDLMKQKVRSEEKLSKFKG